RIGCNNIWPPTSPFITVINVVESRSNITEQTISSASLLLWACQSSSDGVVEYWRNAFGAEITPALHYSIGFARLDLGRLRGAITRGREKDVGRILGREGFRSCSTARWLWGAPRRLECDRKSPGLYRGATAAFGLAGNTPSVYGGHAAREN